MTNYIPLIDYALTGNADDLRNFLCGPQQKHSYYVVMEDHGRRGLEAIVHPEDTRRAIIDRIAHGEFQHVVLIHHIDGLLVEDVTDELFDAAEVLSALEGV